MPTDARLLLYSAILTWIMVMAASILRPREWTRAGFLYNIGNRDQPIEPSPMAGRADRAARNMLENLLLFVAVLMAARLADAPQDRLDLGARLFFYGRLAYFPIYVAGITYVRTLVWAVSIAGLGIIAAAAL